MNEALGGSSQDWSNPTSGSVAFFVGARLGIQPSWIAATPTPWSSKWARLRRSTQAKNEPETMRGISREVTGDVAIMPCSGRFSSFFSHFFETIIMI